MPSDAIGNLDNRLEDIEQLLEAHKALTQFQRARRAAEEAGGGLAQISDIVDSLVTEPGRGRRFEVDALNRSAVVLLSAHLQGYLEDVFSESARILLAGSVQDTDALVGRALSAFSNPQANRIDQLFSSIGLPKIMDGLAWQRASNDSVKRRLAEYIKVRNNIAHGREESVTKQRVVAFERFVRVFARNFDEKVRRELRATMGNNPW